MIFSKDTSKESLRLRLWFLLPLAGVLGATVLSIVVTIHTHVTQDIEANAEDTARIAEHLYLEGIGNSANMLGAAMEVLSTDQALRLALAHRDRAQLLQRSAPLYDELRRKYAVTHMYFSDSNRVNILRVHQPARFGDVINRETTLQAQRSKQTSFGVELGPLGTFTLRLVTPWFAEDGQLLGFVELGMEIDHVLHSVQHIGNVKTFVLINKQFLNRREWESGMRMMGRQPDWERFSDVVVNNQAIEEIPEELTHGLEESLKEEKNVTEQVDEGRSVYRALFQPLKDASGRIVGRMVVLLDVSTQVKALQQITRKSALVGGGALVTLLGFFYWLLGVVGKRLDQDTRKLQEVAEHDGLTGLYNHRVYYLKLDEEFMRRQRTGLPISILLLDIDHFKLVNDRYGHLTGDMVLKTLSEIVMRSCRSMDTACRYGGEEITVILPETDLEGAKVIAERLREAVVKHHFEMGDSKDGHITVSIGVSTSSALIDSSTSLTDSADHALYLAKENGRNRVECARQVVDA